jgi:predicted TIM-barrel fold metal-dependent hydrolase
MGQGVFLLRIAGAVLGAAMLLASSIAHANKIPIIDAHSQAGRDLTLSTILRLMDRGGVARSILSNRAGLTPAGLVAMAAERPDRITASMEVKSQRYFITGEPEFFQRLEAMGREPRYGAISEVLLWHERKGGQGNRKGQASGGGRGQARAEGRGEGRGEGPGRGEARSGGQGGGEEVPEVNLPIDAPQVQAVLRMALKRGFPFVVHYEFRSLDRAGYARRMAELKGLLRAHPTHPIVLIHMGQLYANEAAALIAEFPNIYFMTSHANPLFDSVGGGLQWTKLFEGRKLAPAWKKLFLAHPDRFIMAFDNVLPRHWEPSYYVPQADLWQDGLRDLPRDAANAVAHGNAIRLWKLPPLE